MKGRLMAMDDFLLLPRLQRLNAVPLGEEL